MKFHAMEPEAMHKLLNEAFPGTGEGEKFFDIEHGSAEASVKNDRLTISVEFESGTDEEIAQIRQILGQKFSEAEGLNAQVEYWDLRERTLKLDENLLAIQSFGETGRALSKETVRFLKAEMKKLKKKLALYEASLK